MILKSERVETITGTGQGQMVVIDFHCFNICFIVMGPWQWNARGYFFKIWIFLAKQDYLFHAASEPQIPVFEKKKIPKKWKMQNNSMYKYIIKKRERRWMQTGLKWETEGEVLKPLRGGKGVEKGRKGRLHEAWRSKADQVTSNNRWCVSDRI